MELTLPSLVLTTLKPAESGDGIIVRLYNSSTTPVTGRLMCTLPICEATPLNLLEEPFGEAVSPDEEGGFTLEVHAKRIITLRIVM